MPYRHTGSYSGLSATLRRYPFFFDEFDPHHGSGIAVSWSQLHDASVATRTRLVAGTVHVEQLLDQQLVGEASQGQPPGVYVASLADRDQPFDKTAPLFGAAL